jgi:hypothetical protein
VGKTLAPTRMSGMVSPKVALGPVLTVSCCLACHTLQAPGERLAARVQQLRPLRSSGHYPLVLADDGASFDKRMAGPPLWSRFVQLFFFHVRLPIFSAQNPHQPLVSEL